MKRIDKWAHKESNLEPLPRQGSVLPLNYEPIIIYYNCKDLKTYINLYFYFYLKN